MRRSLRVAIIVLIFSGHAVAAKGKKAPPKKSPPVTMNVNDPAEKELSEKKLAEAKPETEQERRAREDHADAAELARARERERNVGFGNVVVGFGKAPEPGPTPSAATGRTTSVTFMAGGHYEVSPTLTLGARLPWTVGSARQVDGKYSAVQALGALEFAGEYHVDLNPFTRVPILFGIGLPTAQGGYDSASGVRQTQLNEMADAASGYRDPELFGPKRLPLILGVGIDYRRQALSVHAASKLVAGVKLGGALPPDINFGGSYELKPVTLRSVTSAGIGYLLLERPSLFGVLDSWLAYNAVNAVEFQSSEGASTPTRIQVVFEPRIGARFDRISPSIGYVFPIGGRLADTGSSGLELHCDVAF